LPASTQKIFTAGTALIRLGSDYRLSTEVRASGHIAHGTLHGDLVLVGGGDPTLQRADLDALAERLAAGGISRVTGGIDVDDSRSPSRRRTRVLSFECGDDNTARRRVGRVPAHATDGARGGRLVERCRAIAGRSRFPF